MLASVGILFLAKVRALTTQRLPVSVDNNSLQKSLPDTGGRTFASCRTSPFPDSESREFRLLYMDGWGFILYIVRVSIISFAADRQSRCNDENGFFISVAFPYQHVKGIASHHYQFTRTYKFNTCDNAISLKLASLLDIEH